MPNTQSWKHSTSIVGCYDSHIFFIENQQPWNQAAYSFVFTELFCCTSHEIMSRYSI